MKSVSEIRAAWLAQLLSTAAADRSAAESAIRRLYVAATFPEPRHFLWFDSPYEAAWAVAPLIVPHHFLWAQNLASGRLSRDARARVDRARAALGERLGAGDWTAVLVAVGGPRGMSLQSPPVPSRILHTQFTYVRMGLSDDMSALFVAPNENDALYRAEDRLWGGNRGALHSALYAGITESIVGQSFVNDYPFHRMADDEERVGDREPPAILRAAWDVARSAGMWWPFEHAAILSERPAELYVNEQSLLHRADGPAAVFRDGTRVFAWNGKAVPEKWIMQPDTVPARESKGFDPTFAAHVASRAGPTAKGAKKKAKPGSILKAILPADPAARLEQLRTHAGGTLPRYDRYVAGAHREVWQELLALGDGAREDPHAADALAVAYETMRRVESNVRTLVERLTAMGYTFGMSEAGPVEFAVGGGPQGTARMDLNQLMQQLSGSAGVANSPQLSGLFNMMTKARELLAGQAAARAKHEKQPPASRAHVPPPPDIHKRIADFETEYGTLPLSLRAFYAVVGEVNLIGRHPAIDPKDNTVATDPLVVYALDEGAVEYDDEDEEGESPRAITIAPDDLHKANMSGGDPYEMAIPDLRADGELASERHGLFFVDYLRLSFRFGGFPGYDGIENVPAELAQLRAGLVEF
jgi:hypothetical protein